MVFDLSLDIDAHRANTVASRTLDPGAPSGSYARSMLSPTTACSRSRASRTGTSGMGLASTVFGACEASDTGVGRTSKLACLEPADGASARPTRSRGAVMADKEDTVRRGYQAFGEGDMEHFRAIYVPDVVQRQPGNNQTSGEYKGVDNVLGLYGRFFQLSGG